MDIDYMKRAIDLAKKGEGRTSPNPLVGAVIVKNGKIIGEGYHEKYGDLHAEINALKNCEESSIGASMYVTLEPCCHTGKQPPCVEAIVESGISKVVVGSYDPNPLVSGKGFKYLRENGIEVVEGFLQEECDAINEIFFHYVTKKRPYVVLKYAMTMDGKISTYNGLSKWISCEESRKYVHKLRNKYKGILVGIGTVLADNPSLTCRIAGGLNPTRIICDSNLRIPLDSNIVKTAKEVPTIIATCSNDEKKIYELEKLGCKVIKTLCKENKIDLANLMDILAGEKIDGILVEGGAEMNWAFLEANLVRKVYTFISPKIFGGKGAKSPIGGLGVESPDASFRLRPKAITQIDEDFLIESEVLDVYGDC